MFSKSAKISGNLANMSEAITLYTERSSQPWQEEGKSRQKYCFVRITKFQSNIVVHTISETYLKKAADVCKPQLLINILGIYQYWNLGRVGLLQPNFATRAHTLTT